MADFGVAFAAEVSADASKHMLKKVHQIWTDIRDRETLFDESVRVFNVLMGAVQKHDLDLEEILRRKNLTMREIDMYQRSAGTGHWTSAPQLVPLRPEFVGDGWSRFHTCIQDISFLFDQAFKSFGVVSALLGAEDTTTNML